MRLRLAICPDRVFLAVVLTRLQVSAGTHSVQEEHHFSKIGSVYQGTHVELEGTHRRDSDLVNFVGSSRT